MNLNKRIKQLSNFLAGFNSTKLWGVSIGGLFFFYVLKYDRSAPVYENIFYSALGAILTPFFLIAFLGTIAFTILFVWTILEPIFGWLISWLRK